MSECFALFYFQSCLFDRFQNRARFKSDSNIAKTSIAIFMRSDIDSDKLALKVDYWSSTITFSTSSVVVHYKRVKLGK